MKPADAPPLAFEAVAFTYPGRDTPVLKDLSFAMTDPSFRLHRWLGPLGADLPPLFMVGGAVRDRLLGRPHKDIDLICADAEAFAARLGTLHGAKVVPFVRKADTPCHRVVDRADPENFIDLSPIQGGKVTSDLSRRDFTVNAMALPILAGGGCGPLIDPLSGRRDLEKRMIRACGPDAFRADPLRILRAVRIAAQLGFAVDPDTLNLARRDAKAIATVAVERIVKELFDLLRQPASLAHVQALDDLDALVPILPEIAALKECTQNAYHHLDVWQHSLAALEYLETLLGHPEDSFGAAAGPILDLLADPHRLAVLKLACLFHDAGKPACRVVAPDTGKVVFKGHEKAGAALAHTAAVRLKLCLRDRERLVLLVGRHMQVSAWSKPGVRPKTIVKQCRRLGNDVALLVVLSMADTLAKKGPAADGGARRHHRLWSRKLLEDYFEKLVPAFSARPLINGRDLLDLGLAPGPRIGRILKAVRMAQDTGQISSRRAALALARSQIL